MPARLKKNGGLAALYDQNQNWGSVGCKRKVSRISVDGFVCVSVGVNGGGGHMALSVRISRLHLSSWPPL